MLHTLRLSGKSQSTNSQSSNQTALKTLLDEEQRWLSGLKGPAKQLKKLGWQLDEEDWSETLDLGGGAALEQRWLAKGSAYRLAMQAVDQTVLEELRPMLRQNSEPGLALPMHHQLLTGRYQGTKKSPG